MSDFLKVSNAHLSITVNITVLISNHTKKLQKNRPINDIRIEKRHRCQVGDKCVSLDRGQVENDNYKNICVHCTITEKKRSEY